MSLVLTWSGSISHVLVRKADGRSILTWDFGRGMDAPLEDYSPLQTGGFSLPQLLDIEDTVGHGRDGKLVRGTPSLGQNN